MKAINISLILLFLSANALAIPTADAKIDLVKMDTLLGDGTTVSVAPPQNEVTTETKLARLYKSKDYRIKKALTFAVKKDVFVLV